MKQTEKVKSVDIEADEVVIESNDKSPKAKKKAREYMPEFRSGAYALLVTLFENETNEDDENASMTKASLIKAAQKHSDASFTSVI